MVMCDIEYGDVPAQEAAAPIVTSMSVPGCSRERETYSLMSTGT